MAKYAYPAIFVKEDSGLYAINFPDLQGCYTSGENLIDAFEMATDVLAFKLRDMENDGEIIPPPSELSEVDAASGFVNYVFCDTEGYEITNCDPKEQHHEN
jgi:predicted RNase H-like HicB family nuclease